MSEKEDKLSLAAALKAKPKKIENSYVKEKLKTAPFSQPIQRLAELKEIKNSLEIMKYAWPTEKKLKAEKGVVTIGKVTLKKRYLDRAPAAEETKKASTHNNLVTPKKTENSPTSYSASKQEVPISDFTQWINNKTKSMSKKATKSKKEKKKSGDKEHKKKLKLSKKDKEAKGKKQDKKKDKKSKTELKSVKKAKGKKSKSKSELKKKIELSIKKREYIATETLAEVYIEQGYYKKAIETYKQLSLINPEKSSFFAPLIKDLKNKLK